MCTAIIYKQNENYLFGRTLDLEYNYNESVIIMPRNFNLNFNDSNTYNAIIGIGIVTDNYPLFYEAMNEHGLCMAGLNFPISSFYHDEKFGKTNLAEYEFIPYILSLSKTLDEAKQKVSEINIINKSFNEKFKSSHLHWIISDGKESITIESVKEGLKVYDNIFNILTNEPSFDLIINKNKNIDSLTSIPSDYSSLSRFKRINNIINTSFSPKSDNIGIVNHFFKILSTVSEINGINKKNDLYHKTVYTSCYDTNNLAVFYNTYSNNQISKVTLINESLNGNSLITYKLNTEETIYNQN